MLLPRTFDLCARDIEIMPVEHDERSNRFWPEYPCCLRVKHTDLSRSVNSQHPSRYCGTCS